MISKFHLQKVPIVVPKVPKKATFGTTIGTFCVFSSFCLFSTFISRTKKFFFEKSIKVSLFRGNINLNIRYFATYKNETFDIFYRKVS